MRRRSRLLAHHCLPILNGILDETRCNTPTLHLIEGVPNVLATIDLARSVKCRTTIWWYYIYMIPLTASRSRGRHIAIRCRLGVGSFEGSSRRAYDVRVDTIARRPLRFRILAGQSGAAFGGAAEEADIEADLGGAFDALLGCEFVPIVV